MSSMTFFVQTISNMHPLFDLVGFFFLRLQRRGMSLREEEKEGAGGEGTRRGGVLDLSEVREERGGAAAADAGVPWEKTFERGIFIGGVLLICVWTMLVIAMSATGWRKFDATQDASGATRVIEVPLSLSLL